MKYEPYNFDSFRELLSHAHNLGWYSGSKVLFNIKCEGDFEGWSGRATETWEQRFTLTSEEIKTGSGKTIPAINVYGETIKEVCDKALKAIKLNDQNTN